MFEQYVKSGKKKLEYLRNYREIAASVKEVVKEYTAKDGYGCAY